MQKGTFELKSVYQNGRDTKATVERQKRSLKIEKIKETIQYVDDSA